MRDCTIDVLFSCMRAYIYRRKNDYKEKGVNFINILYHYYHTYTHAFSPHFCSIQTKVIMNQGTMTKYFGFRFKRVPFMSTIS